MDILPLTIWREARGENPQGMLAVAWVIHNRATDLKKHWPTDPEHVCLQRKQFSCWNDTDGERDIYPDSSDPQYSQAVFIANAFKLNAQDPDPTGGATFYVNPRAVARNPFEYPGFVKTIDIGRHSFYKYL